MTPYERIYAVVARIPRGRVATYGQVAALAGLPGRARQVGYALHATPPTVRIPWQRVVNAQGTISLRPGPGGDLQAALLQAEGVDLDDRGRIELARFQWQPRSTEGRPGRPRARGLPGTRSDRVERS